MIKACVNDKDMNVTIGGDGNFILKQLAVLIHAIEGEMSEQTGYTKEQLHMILNGYYDKEVKINYVEY